MRSVSGLDGKLAASHETGDHSTMMYKKAALVRSTRSLVDRTIGIMNLEAGVDEAVEMNSNKQRASWSKILEECRSARCELEETEASSFFETFRIHFSSFTKQISSYVARVELSEREKATGNVDKQELKELVFETQNALRFGLSCLSIQDDVVRKSLQDEAITCGWHDGLFRILSCKKGDSKCRLYAAKLLTNLVTSNADSSQVVASSLTLSPSEESISFKVRETVSNSHDEGGCEIHSKPNWVDMILSSAQCGDRNVLAAVVAALHNSISCLCWSSPLHGEPYNFHKRVACNGLLMSTLLRQVISVESLKESRQSGNSPVEHADAATEWISILLMNLCHLGMLPTIYQSIGGKLSQETALPEHVVLLHCLRSEIESATLIYNNRDSPLGNEAGAESVMDSHLFLISLFSSVRSTVDSNELDDAQVALSKSLLLTVLDIFAEVLGSDSRDTAKIRLAIGKETTFFQEVAVDLGEMVDALSERNLGLKVREMTVLHEEQRTLTTLVRVLGNLCFHCRQNQDLLRTTLVPPSSGRSNDTAVERNALHVLLSCTSFSHSCFTLREWAVVAIRNALDDNEQNQAEVAKLQAQQPVQSTELNQMGIRIDLDPRGNVSVAPLEKIDEDAKGETDCNNTSK